MRYPIFDTSMQKTPKSNKSNKIIAIDFDGTLCENNFPHIGAPKLGMIDAAIKAKENGARLILWTCRSGKQLEEAVNWCSSYGLRFDAVNDNLPESVKRFGNNSRKIYANMYVDDKSFRRISCDGAL